MYFDYQSTTPVDTLVATAMEPFWATDFGNPHSSEHIFGWNSAKAVDVARRQLASLVAADEDEIVFTSGATEANNLALWGLLSGGEITRLITTKIEHKSILETANYWQRRGVNVDFLQVNNEGMINVEHLQEKVRAGKALVSIIGVNNEIGTIQDIKTISKVVHKSDGILHVDASQMPSCVDIDVFELGIDLLSLSSHKIYGPKGIGALYLSRDLQAEFKPMMLGGGQEQGLRAGTLPTPLIVGFGVAACLMLSNGRSDRDRIKEMVLNLYTGLKRKISNLELNGPNWERRHPGNLNIFIPNTPSKTLLEMLQPNLAASTGSACTSGVNEPSYVLREIGLTEEQATQSLRLSIGRFTTEKEVAEAIRLIATKVEIITSNSM